MRLTASVSWGFALVLCVAFTASPGIAEEANQEVVARVTGTSGPLARANFGNGLVELGSGAELKSGQTVFAGQDSSITLYYYKPGCEFVLSPETYLEIRPDAPCQRAGTPNDNGSAAAASADLGLAIGGVVLVGGGAAAAVLLLSGDEDEEENNPVTPQ
jgi:hypothetical protein